MAQTRQQLHPGFVLHQRSYRNSSVIVELFTELHGRISVVARGVRKPKSHLAALLQPFTPLLLSWVARGELGTLTAVENDGAPLLLNHRSVINGLYVNELLMRLLHRNDPYPELYAHYLTVLQQLCEKRAVSGPGTAEEQQILRNFERRLLQELGYGLVLDHEVENGSPLNEEALYLYDFERGPVLCSEVPSVHGTEVDYNRLAAGSVRIHGKTLLALAQGVLTDRRSLRESKRLMRAALALHLGVKPLQSRKLYNMMELRANGAVSGNTISSHREN